MTYAFDSVVHSFEADGYRVEFRSTGNNVSVRAFEVETGVEVATVQLGAGLRLRIQDEQEKAVALIRQDMLHEQERHHQRNRIAWDAYRKRKEAIERSKDCRGRPAYERD